MRVVPRMALARKDLDRAVEEKQFKTGCLRIPGLTLDSQQKGLLVNRGKVLRRLINELDSMAADLDPA